MPIVKVNAYKCTRCDHVWLPKPFKVLTKRDLGPERCPHCKSAGWRVSKGETK